MLERDRASDVWELGLEVELEPKSIEGVVEDSAAGIDDLIFAGVEIIDSGGNGEGVAFRFSSDAAVDVGIVESSEDVIDESRVLEWPVDNACGTDREDG